MHLGLQNSKTLSLAASKWPKSGCGASGGSNEFYLIVISIESLVVGISAFSCTYKVIDMNKSSTI